MQKPEFLSAREAEKAGGNEGLEDDPSSQRVRLHVRDKHVSSYLYSSLLKLTFSLCLKVTISLSSESSIL